MQVCPFCAGIRNGGSNDNYRRIALIQGRRPITRTASKACPPGQILRRSYTTKTGRHIPARCQTGNGLSAVIGPARRTGIVNYKFKHEGILRRFGYSQTAPTGIRRKAIHQAVQAWKPNEPTYQNALGLFRHMNLILTRSRNRASNLKGLMNFSSDVDWLKRTYRIGRTKPRAAKQMKQAIVRIR